MPDDLRDRIAAVITSHLFADEDAEAVADAVIEALRLHAVEGTVARFEGKTYRRYITDWTPDELIKEAAPAANGVTVRYWDSDLNEVPAPDDDEGYGMLAGLAGWLPGLKWCDGG